jgi:hypothetical protein
VVYFHLGRISEAAGCARDAIELAGTALGPAHRRMAVYLNNYANILKHMHRIKEAKEYQRLAEAILAQAPGRDSDGGYTIDIAALR